MTFAELNTAWNELRNVVMGRGVSKPAGVSEALYTKVGNASERWQKFFTNASLLDQVAFDLTAHEFLTEYRSLSDAAKSEGLQLKTPMLSASETIARVASDVVKVAAPKVQAMLAIGAMVLVVPLVAYAAMRGRR